MKPSNRRQVRIFQLAQDNCTRITAEQKAYALTHCLTHDAYRTKKDTSCLDCGHIWAGEQAKKVCTCPKCGTKLTIKDTRCKTLEQRDFFTILQVVEEFQVIRHYEVRSTHKAGTERKANAWEVAQIWLEENGKLELIARNRGSMGFVDTFHGQLEIRSQKPSWYKTWEDKYDLYPAKVYPQMQVQPIYKRNGFKGNIGNSTPYGLFRAILTDSKAETLLKAGQHALLAYCTGRASNYIHRYWATIKICIRNNYTVKNGKDYLDYIEMAQNLHMDIRNPLFACPANLHKAHQAVTAKTQEIQRRRDEERRANDARAKAEEEEACALMRKNAPKKYIEDKCAYFDLLFTNGKFTITVLKSVKEFKAEGEILKHCVYTRDYYNEADSLILSARIDGKPIETIEIDLTKMSIEQARGWDNKPTPHHEEIVALMNKNMRHVRKIHRAIQEAKASPSQQVAA